MKTITMKTQQGDVLLRRLSTMPEGATKTIAKGRCVLAHGESGHCHVVEQDDAELIAIGDRMLLSLGSEATVQHEEHGAQVLAPGIWEIGRVREKDWFADMVRPVRD
jgi:hypothetical protein